MCVCVCVSYVCICCHTQYFQMSSMVPVSIYSTWTSKDSFINESSTVASAGLPVTDRNIKVKVSQHR